MQVNTTTISKEDSTLADGTLVSFNDNQTDSDINIHLSNFQDNKDQKSNFNQKSNPN